MKKRKRGKAPVRPAKNVGGAARRAKAPSLSVLATLGHLLGSSKGLRAGVIAVAVISGVVGLTKAGASDGAKPPTPNEYHLAAQDKIRIRAFEWRASRDEVFEWTAVNAEYFVGAGGTISLPLVGDIVAAGQTPNELASAIGRALKSRIGLVESPDVSVEVVQYRPFYIVGDVDKPGEYPYRPGITLLQAVSLAGGDRRDADKIGSRFEREVIIANGDLSILELELTTCRARKARLEAELKNDNVVNYPDELLYSQARSTSLLIEQENLIFRARREAHKNALHATTQLKDYLDKEIVSLIKQIATQDTQLNLANEELTGILKLYDRGLSIAQRKLALQRELAQLQGDRLRIEASVIKAKQDSSAAGLAIIELNNKRLNDLTTELRATQSALDEAIRKADTARALIFDSSRTSRIGLAAKDKSALKPSYTIVRSTSNGLEEIAGEESSVLAAGDTVKVAILRDSDASPTTASLPSASNLNDRAKAAEEPPPASTPKELPQLKTSGNELQSDRAARAGY